MTASPGSVSRAGLRAAQARVALESPATEGTAPAAPVIAGLGVTWRLTRRSLGDRAPAGTSRLLELTVRVEGLDTGRASASVVVVDPASGASAALECVGLSPGGCEVIADIRSQSHVECPGVLHATVEGPGDGAGREWRLVYARTPVLSALGVPGGRAEPVGVSVRTV